MKPTDFDKLLVRCSRETKGRIGIVSSLHFFIPSFCSIMLSSLYVSQMVRSVMVYGFLLIFFNITGNAYCIMPLYLK